MSDMRIACFKVDVTPPTGAQMAYNINKKADTPIFIRGLAIDDGRSRAVIISCDFIYIWGRTWLDWRRAVAKAAGTSADRVFLHSIHQHDSMRISPEWNEFTRRSGHTAVDEEYCRATIEKLKTTVTAAVAEKWRKVVKLMTAERRLSGLASNRRIIDENGKCCAMRYSMCADPELRARPVGVIDPFLRTIAFCGRGGRIIAAMHFYATHPMAAYLREMASQDVPGAALAHAERKFGKSVFNMYLTGCGGNVTFGKYHLGDKEKSLALLGRRLCDGIAANLNHLEDKPLGKLSFAKVVFDFPLDPAITEETMLARIEEAAADKPDNGAIARLIIARSWSKWRKCPVCRMSIGDEVDILSLQGEMCVEYQLYAQSLVPEHFLACTAYGNGLYHYIPTARMFEEGGYEPGASITTPEIESRLKNAINKVLEGLRQ